MSTQRGCGWCEQLLIGQEGRLGVGFGNGVPKLGSARYSPRAQSAAPISDCDIGEWANDCKKGGTTELFRPFGWKSYF